MPGHVKRGGSGDPDPDPLPFLVVSSSEKQRDLAKVIINPENGTFSFEQISLNKAYLVELNVTSLIVTRN